MAVMHHFSVAYKIKPIPPVHMGHTLSRSMAGLQQKTAKEFVITSAETRMWGGQLATILALYSSKGVAPEVNLRECI